MATLQQEKIEHKLTSSRPSAPFVELDLSSASEAPKRMSERKKWWQEQNKGELIIYDKSERQIHKSFIPDEPTETLV